MNFLRIFFLFLLIITSQFSIAQKDTINKARNYSFLIQDSPSQLLTMRQSNQNYLSAYRLFTRGLNASIDNHFGLRIGYILRS